MNQSNSAARHARWRVRVFVWVIGGCFGLAVVAEWLSLAAGPGHYHRAWEQLYSRETGFFKPNQRRLTRTYGDLARMTRLSYWRVYRQERFTTDRYGFRNAEAAPGTFYPIIVVGDSDMAGSGLSDEQTFAANLQRLSGMRVYNYGGGAFYSMGLFLRDPRFIASPPKVLVWESVERFITAAYFSSIPAQAASASAKTGPSIEPAREQRCKRWINEAMAAGKARSVWKELAMRLAAEARYAVLREVSPLVIVGEKSRGARWLFYRDDLRMFLLSSQARGLPQLIEAIVAVQALCKARGIQLVFLPLPDKTRVYRDLLPEPYRSMDNQGEDFLPSLVDGLRARGVLVADLPAVFKAARRTRPEWLYWPDDTHWSLAGARIAAEETYRQLQTDGLLSGSTGSNGS